VQPETRVTGPALTTLAVVSSGTTTAVGLPGAPTITRPEPALTTAVLGHESWANAGMGALATAIVLIAAAAARLSNVCFMTLPPKLLWDRISLQASKSRICSILTDSGGVRAYF